MADYATNIDPDDYKYMRTVTITEQEGIDHVDYTVGFKLNSSTFVFSQARVDGNDFRLAEMSNGSGVLNMWKATWKSYYNIAVLWFKLPRLFAYETKTLYAFWGNEDAPDSSDIDSVSLLFNEDFVSGIIDAHRWYHVNTATYSLINKSLGLYNTSSQIYNSDTSILTGINSWEMEVGCYFGDTVESTSGYLNGFYFLGTENDIEVYIYPQGAYCVRHTAVDGSTLVTYAGTEKGMETDSYCVLTFKYYEPYDYFYYGMSERSTYSDYLSYNERQVEGDTRVDYIKITGRNNTDNSYNYIDYISIKEIEVSEPVWDISNLYVEYGDLESVLIDNSVYDSDLTSGSFYHYSSIGGDPYTLSDNRTENDSYVWYSTTNSGFDFTTVMEYVGSFSSSQNLDGYSFRQFIPSSALSGYGGKIKLTLQGSTSWSFDDCFIGYSSDTYSFYSFDGNSTRVTFNGVKNGTVSSDGLESDEIVFDFDSSKDLIVAFDISSSSTDLVYDDGLNAVGYIGCYKNTGSNESSLIEVSNYTTQVGRVYGVKKIEASSSEELIIDFGRNNNNLVSRTLTHYDNDHVYGYNASRLSEEIHDVHGISCWKATTTSGVWASIDLTKTNKKAVGCIAVRGMSNNLSGMVEDYKFEGTNTDPRAHYTNWVTLNTGTFEQAANWQVVHFVNGTVYQYYRLYVDSTYGSNVVLKDWGLYEYDSRFDKKVISQLRIRPITFSSGEYYFPKNILFYGSNDMLNWTELLGLTSTYNPFSSTGEYGRQQRYSFTNTVPYWCYKLEFTINWKDMFDKIGISEWEMVETLDESRFYRILLGDSNSYSSISSNDGFSFDIGVFQVSSGNVLNIIGNDKLVDYEIISEDVNDINIV